MHAARERQHKGHDMGRDMVVEDAAKIGHHHVAGDEFREVIPLGRAGGWGGQPLELGGCGQQLWIQGAETGLRRGESG